MNKPVIAVVFAVVVAAAGAGYFLMQNLDALVKGLIEEIGTSSVGTEVRVVDVTLNLTEGEAGIEGLTIANPEGFSPESLFTMGSIDVSIDTGSLSEDVYVIRNIAVDGAQVLAEQVGGGTNLQALMNNMKKGGSEAAPADEAEAGSDVRLAVESLSFTNGNVMLRSDVFGERTLTLPAINMENLGTREQGLTPQELGEEISGRLIGEVRDAVSDELKNLARDAAKEKLKEKVGESLGKLKGLFSRGDDTGEEEESSD